MVAIVVDIGQKMLFCKNRHLRLMILCFDNWWQPKAHCPGLTTTISSTLQKFLLFFLGLSYSFWIYLNKVWTNHVKYLLIRCLMVSTNQADPGCLYCRISWILMERHWFYFFHPLHFLQSLKSLKHWLLQKLSMKIFDQKVRFLIKNRYFGALIFQKI